MLYVLIYFFIWCFSILYHGCQTPMAPVLWDTWSFTRATRTISVVARHLGRPSLASKLWVENSCPMVDMEPLLKKSKREASPTLLGIYCQVSAGGLLRLFNRFFFKYIFLMIGPIFVEPLYSKSNVCTAIL